MKRLLEFGFLACFAPAVAAHPAKHRNPSVGQEAAELRPGQYIWNSDIASTGRFLLVIYLGAQRVLLYRNGVPVAASTVSTGRKGRATPTGFFTILQKEEVHRSRTYDDAPMPYMQRLTWRGVAMHGGHVGGHPASHGCIRLPMAFAKRLYRVTKVGTPVMIRT